MTDDALDELAEYLRYTVMRSAKPASPLHAAGCRWLATLERARALLAAPEPRPEPPRCPKCGYTRDDCLFHMDHHLCGEPEPDAAPSPAQDGCPRCGKVTRDDDIHTCSPQDGRDLDALVERLRSWRDLAGWADGGWELPPKATAALNRVTTQAADAITALRARAERAEADAHRLDWLESTTAQAETELGMKCGWYVDETGAPIIRGELEAWWSTSLRAAIDRARTQGGDE